MEKSNLAIAPKMQEAIKKKVSKKLPQDGEKPFILAEGGLDAYFRGVKALCVAVGNVLYIVPALIMGILEGCTEGMRAGLKMALSKYEKHLS